MFICNSYANNNKKTFVIKTATSADDTVVR